MKKRVVYKRVRIRVPVLRAPTDAKPKSLIPLLAFEKETRKMSRGSTFQDKWFSDPRFSPWISSGKKPNVALCKVCNDKIIDIASMGATALTSHMKGMKHQEKMKSKTNPSNLSLFFKSEKTSQSQMSQASSSSSASVSLASSNTQPSAFNSTTGTGGSLSPFISKTDTVNSCK